MKPPTESTIALIAIARTTFDVALANAVAAQARAHLDMAGLNVIGPSALVTSSEEAQAAAGQLAAQPPDLLIILQASFADSSMVMAIAQQVDSPLLLWAVPEEHTGGRLRLNSLCGINLAGHALKRAGRRYEYVYAPPDDLAALDKIHSLAKARRVQRRLQGARIGRIGEHPNGFDTCRVDSAALLQRFGLELVPVELNTVFAGARAIPAEMAADVADHLRGRVNGLDQLDTQATNGTLSAYVALHGLTEAQGLSGLAVRCWPEFFTDLGCAACGALSMLSDALKPCSCEADVNGTITQLILQWLSGEPAFGSDIVSVDSERDGLVLWHCGLAPLSMADPEARPETTIHSNRKLPLLMQFPLKPGRVTLARLSEATGAYRLVIGSGEMQRAPRSFSGTTGVVRFERPAAAVLDTILTEGLEHHISLTYGDHVDALLALANMLELPVLRL